MGYVRNRRVSGSRMNMPAPPKVDEPDDPLAPDRLVAGKTMPWLVWVVGAAACAALILIVTHLTEEEEFLRLMEKIEPYWLLLALLLFVLVGLGVTLFVSALPGGGMSRLTTRLRRFAKLARLLDLVDHAHPESFHDRRLLLRAFALHTLNFLLDASTIWVAARALGVTAPAGGVFASFMVSTLFRTIGIMPGGLGTFETASVMSLKSIGLPLPVGLSATLLFRGLSFWLPMIPGLFCSRHMLVKKH